MWGLSLGFALGQREVAIEKTGEAPAGSRLYSLNREHGQLPKKPCLSTQGHRATCPTDPEAAADSKKSCHYFRDGNAGERSEG